MKYFTICFKLMGHDEELEIGLDLDPEDYSDFSEKINEAFTRSARFTYSSIGIDFSHVLYFYTFEQP